jgi:hypothetical protein
MGANPRCRVPPSSPPSDGMRFCVVAAFGFSHGNIHTMTAIMSERAVPGTSGPVRLKSETSAGSHKLGPTCRIPRAR